MKIPENLIEKYNVPVPRYTSYPPANFFTTEFDSHIHNPDYATYSYGVSLFSESGKEKTCPCI